MCVLSLLIINNEIKLCPIVPMVDELIYAVTGSGFIQTKTHFSNVIFSVVAQWLQFSLHCCIRLVEEVLVGDKDLAASSDQVKVHFVIHSLIPSFFSKKVEIFIPVGAFRYIMLKIFLANLLV